MKTLLTLAGTENTEVRILLNPANGNYHVTAWDLDYTEDGPFNVRIYHAPTWTFDAVKAATLKALEPITSWTF